MPSTTDPRPDSREHWRSVYNAADAAGWRSRADELRRRADICDARARRIEVAAQPLSRRRKTTYCDECQLWLPCHKYDARYRAEEVLYLCDDCVLEVQP